MRRRSRWPRSRRAASSPGRCSPSGSCSPNAAARDGVRCWCSTRSTPGSAVRPGAAVGRELAALAETAQVLCITHLAQVAACANAQIVVRKAEHAGRTRASAQVALGRGSGGGALPDAGRGGGLRACPSTRGGALERGRASRRAERRSKRARSAETGATQESELSLMARRMRSRRRGAADAVTGPALVDRRTKDLVRRLQPGAGSIAVIDHTDIDRVAAEGLIAEGAVAVVNGGPVDLGPVPERRADPDRRSRDPADRRRRVPRSSTGSRKATSSGSSGGEVWRGDELVATGTVLTVESIEAAMEAARGNIGSELERFAANTLEYIQREAKLTFEPIELPPLDCQIKGRHAIVVVRGHDYRSDLAALKPYLREYQPGAHRCRRGRGRAARGRLPARHHHRRLRLRVRPRVALRGRAHPPRASRRARARAREPARVGRSVRGVRHRRDERGRRDAPRVRGRSESSSSPSARTRRWWSSSTRAERGCRRRS